MLPLGLGMAACLAHSRRSSCRSRDVSAPKPRCARRAQCSRASTCRRTKAPGCTWYEASRGPFALSRTASCIFLVNSLPLTNHRSHVHVYCYTFWLCCTCCICTHSIALFYAVRVVIVGPVLAVHHKFEYLDVSVVLIRGAWGLCPGIYSCTTRVRDLTVKASRRLTFQLTVNFTSNHQM